MACFAVHAAGQKNRERKPELTANGKPLQSNNIIGTVEQLRQIVVIRLHVAPLE